MSEQLTEKMNSLEEKLDKKLDTFMEKMVDMTGTQIQILEKLTNQSERNDNQDKAIEDHQEEINQLRDKQSHTDTSIALLEQSLAQSQKASEKASETNKELVKEVKSSIAYAVKWVMGIFSGLILIAIIGGVLTRFAQ